MYFATQEALLLRYNQHCNPHHRLFLCKVTKLVLFVRTMTHTRDRWAFLFAVAALIVVVASADPSEGVTLRLRNESDNYLSIHWIDPRSQDTFPIKTDVFPRSPFTLNSFLTHRFEVREEPDPETGHCGDHKDDACKIGTFQVTESIEQGEFGLIGSSLYDWKQLSCNSFRWKLFGANSSMTDFFQWASATPHGYYYV